MSPFQLFYLPMFKLSFIDIIVCDIFLLSDMIRCYLYICCPPDMELVLSPRCPSSFWWFLKIGIWLPRVHIATGFITVSRPLQLTEIGIFPR